MLDISSQESNKQEDKVKVDEVLPPILDEVDHKVD